MQQRPVGAIGSTKENRMTTEFQTLQEKYITDLLLPYYMGEEAFSVNEIGKCVYNGPNESHCAFAKACKDPYLIEEGSSAKGCLASGDVLKPEAKALSMTGLEWNAVQLIHDNYQRRIGNIFLGLDRLSHYGPFTELRAAIKAYKEKAPTTK